MVIGCMEFLARKRPPKIGPVVVVFGDDDFLRRQAIAAVRTLVVGSEPDDFTFARFVGNETSLRDLSDELATPPLLGDRKLIVMEAADRFVSDNRSELESIVAHPSEFAVLLLDLASFPATTRLAKAVEAHGLAIDARGPQRPHLVASWCIQWANARYGKSLDKTAADWLVELSGTNLGVLDRELDKLSTYVGAAPAIVTDDIGRLVAGTATEKVFKLLDLALAGQPARAIEMLDRLFVAGESEVGMLAMMNSQLRKLTHAARMAVAGQPLRDALLAAGVPQFALATGEAQLRRMGRERMIGMLRRLLAADYHVKGGTTFDKRIVVERLLLELAH